LHSTRPVIQHPAGDEHRTQQADFGIQDNPHRYPAGIARHGALVAEGGEKILAESGYDLWRDAAGKIDAPSRAGGQRQIAGLGTENAHEQVQGLPRERIALIQGGLCDGGEINADDLQLPASDRADEYGAAATAGPDADESLDDFIARIEEVAIRDALERANQNKTAAAKLLGITFRALRYKLEKLGID